MKEAEKALGSARKSATKKQYEGCVSTSSSVIEVSPLLQEARELRAGCYFGMGNIDDGVGELTYVVPLSASRSIRF